MGSARACERETGCCPEVLIPFLFGIELLCYRVFYCCLLRRFYGWAGENIRFFLFG